MTLEEIFKLFDKTVQSNKKIGLILLIVSTCLIIAGAAMYFSGKEGDVPNIGIFLASAGAFFFLLGAIFRFSKIHEKGMAYAKDVLQNHPKDLVWIYVFIQKTNGQVTTTEVLLNFRNGKTISVPASYLPGKDTENFMQVLSRINPDAHVGFSEELKYKFKKKTL